MSAAVELARYGVTANMVHPPVTDTGWVTDEVRDAGGRQRRRMFHIASPAEVTQRDRLPGFHDTAGLITGNVITLR